MFVSETVMLKMSLGVVYFDQRTAVLWSKYWFSVEILLYSFLFFFILFFRLKFSEIKQKKNDAKIGATSVWESLLKAGRHLKAGR